MRLVSLAAVTPPHGHDNEGFLDVVAGWLAEAGAEPAERARVVARTRHLFERAGSRHRYVHPSPERGYAIELLRQAVEQALKDAARRPQDIDLLIYCSVARGWIEPSTAAAVQAAIGAVNASCFDVLEACAGWMRAIELADALMSTGRYRNALVVGVEAGMRDVAVPRGRTAEMRDEHLAAFTVGEAASAMLLEPDPMLPLEINLRSDGRHHDACLIPLPMIDAFLAGDSMLPEPGRFLSHSDRLFSATIAALTALMRERLARADADSIDLFIPHAASESAAEAGRRAVGIPRAKFFCGHADFGNTVSMAMPTALHHALRSGRAKRGDRICFLVASAGITYGYGIMTC